MPVLDFFKKKPASGNGDDQAVVQPQAPVQQPVQEVTETTTTVGTTQSYNGIGNPPGGQAYNGIGNPPAPTPPQPQVVTPPVIAAMPPQPAVPVTDPVTPTADPAAATDQSAPVDPNAPKDVAKAAEEKPLDSNIDTQKRTELDLMTHLTQRSNRVFMAAQQKAKELKGEFVDSEHVLHGLLADPEIYKLFTEKKIQPQIIDQELDKLYQKGTSEKTPLPSPRVKRILENALVTARKLGYEFISPEHILLALYEEGEGVGARTLAKLGLKKEDINKQVTGKKEGLEGKDGPAGKDTGRSMLEQYTNDLTLKAEQGQLDPVVERSEVIERAIHIISRRTKNNPALVGEAGVGKTAIVEGLAQKIVKKEVPESLIGKRILQLDLMSIIAGASHRGEFEERMKKIIEEITNSKGQIILFVDEIHNLVGAGAGGEGALDASNFLKPALARGELQLIGATTLTEYRKYVEKDPALERRFQPVLVPEPTEEQAVKMVKALRDKYEAFHRVKIPDASIEAAVKLSKRYIGDRFLPDKAIDLIDEASAAVRLPLISLPEEIRSIEDRQKQLQQELGELEKRGDRVRASIMRPKLDDLNADLKIKQDDYNQKKSQTTTSVSEQSIKDIISRWTGIPITRISESETEKLTKLEDIIHKRLINQENAVTPVAEAVRRGRAGLKSNNRPIGSFVFLGPTGVGKTELSKTLAEVLFGQEEAMIRFDMTEFMEKHEVAKLLGAPPGYIGYEEGGKLTEAVRRKPYSVVLFDEVEKAHPDIFNILLQILDDGRLTDNKGHVISFKNTVVICTSNIGTKMIQDDILSSGPVDIEEPTLLSTYTFSPRGRQIMTIMGKVFERESANEPWKPSLILDYFAGQKVENEQQADGKPAEAAPDFPGKEFDTHAMSAKGVEMITSGGQMFQRTATTAKVWKSVSLIDYFKDGVVINALPDAPEEQLPTAKLKTQAFSPQELEVVTFRDRFWKRKDGETNWETGTLKDYFEGQTMEADIKKDEPVALKIDEKKPDEKPVEAKEEKKTDEPAAVLPTNYWDIHAFNPDGSEIIVVGEKIWSKQANQQTWKVQTITEFFGKDFPLDKELEEKQKIEEELSKNQYEKTKAKVMDELRKFFRPELINRFDEVIVFEPLKYQHMLQISELNMRSLRKLLEEQNMGFAWTESTKKELVRQGFDPLYGARPLKRTIQKLIENPISTLIIEQKLKESDLVNVDFDGDSFVFNIEKVTFVNEEELKKQKIRKFECIESHYSFETEVAENATIICPVNAKEKVQEIVIKTEENIEQLKKEEVAEPNKSEDPKKMEEPVKTEEPKKDDVQKPTSPTTPSA
ncbi:AAA family ATPase [Candidatus Woesebacteria bacterium]|nr:AAA family ATPase [Candidatus Woesebacteria bacterium]